MIGNNTTFWNSADSRKVAIKVTGVSRQDIAPKSVYTIIVPYSRLSQTIQQINRLGGQIIEVSMRSLGLIEPSQISPTPQILETPINATEPELSKSSEASKMTESETSFSTLETSIKTVVDKIVKEPEMIVNNSAVEPISNVFEEVTQTAPNANLPEAKVFPETLTPLNAPKTLSRMKTKLRKKKSRLKEAIAKESKDKKSKKK